jgi:hypothetical protein
MSRIDSLKEAKRGIGVTCPCGKSARITVRGRTLCYECFDRDMGYIVDPEGYLDRMRERNRELDRMRDDSILVPIEAQHDAHRTLDCIDGDA